jgi:hypothetical protein
MRYSIFVEQKITLDEDWKKMGSNQANINLDVSGQQFAMDR